MGLITNGKLSPAGHALVTALLSLLSGTLVTVILTAGQYLSNNQKIDGRQMILLLVFTATFSLVNGAIKLALASTDPTLVAIGTAANSLETQVEQRVLQSFDLDKGPIAPPRNP